MGLVIDMTAYWEIAGLEDVYLEDSWVIDIVSRPGMLWLEIDLVLRESHPLFMAPKPGEQHCYKRGRLIFRKVTELHWTDQGRPPALGPAGERDYGSVDEMTIDGNRFRATGDFGTMDFIAGSVVDIEWGTAT